MGEEPSGSLADSLEGVGGASVDGSTRTKVVQQMEGLRHKLLTKALAEHPNKDARPVTAYENVADDKCAGSWLLAIPNRDNCLSTPIFKEAISSHLCLPSPALREGGWVGRPVGSRGVVVDKFGDNILCCHEIPGDSWRHRHDEVKMAVYREACLSKVPVSMGSLATSCPLLFLRREVSCNGAEPARERFRTSCFFFPPQRVQNRASRSLR